MTSGIMGSHDGATAGPPDHQRQHKHEVQHNQRPLPGPLDDGASSSSASRSSYSRDFSKPTNPSRANKTSLLSSLNPQNWSRKMRVFAIVGFVLTIVALVPGNYFPLKTLKTSQRLILILSFPAHQLSPCRSHCAQATRGGDRPVLINPPSTQPIANNMDLRIMSLGASITFGLRSTDGNGYRDELRVLLNKSGTKNVEYVGSRTHGNMASNAVEGWPGLRIDQVLPKAKASVPNDLPNVILLNVGTNDCVQNFNMNNTTQNSTSAPELTSNANYTVGTRMRMMVEDLLEWSPNATVVMSTLINNRFDKTQARVLVANEQFRAVAAELQDAGSKVVLAEMTAAAGGPNMTTMFDQTHPNDVGYAMMADRFYEAMVEASTKGMISAPAPR
ncbi:hypothetical protein INS49_003617 [Diaporthe citri]|uniref:uncharacterized protein n=1 Tax=Diaporthe citri TaxID=83186 RepID=UPI001C82036D|nr:uncharacterized protein INS49_003617 [Diaporthe citri]KAG6355654.1 hypothetical protein INS49_003617 [Diaporthe citri]